MSEPARRLDRVYTYADYRLWRDDQRWELIEGTAWSMSPAPTMRHQAIVATITRIAATWCMGRPCAVFPAPFDVLLPDRPDQPEDEVTSVVRPDVSVVCERSRLREWGCCGAPNLVVEILSPHTTQKDLNDKYALYEKHRVPEYWVVDPGNRFVQVYRIGADGRYGDALLLAAGGASRGSEAAAIAESVRCPDLVIPLEELFGEP